MLRNRQKLNREFKAPSDPVLQPLKSAMVADGGTLVRADTAGQCLLYVFSPTPKETFASIYMSEIAYPRSFTSRPDDNKVLILFAPDSSSTGWTLLGKVWLAYCIEQKSVKHLASLGASVGYSPAMKELTKLWSEIPTPVQRQAEEMLNHNREIAKPFGGSRRFFFDGKGKTYEISNTNNVYEFLNTYREANPNLRVAE